MSLFSKYEAFTPEGRWVRAIGPTTGGVNVYDPEHQEAGGHTSWKRFIAWPVICRRRSGWLGQLVHGRGRSMTWVEDRPITLEPGESITIEVPW